MNDIAYPKLNIQTYKLATAKGSLYVKKWLPEQLVSNTPIILMHDSLGCVSLWKDFPEKLSRSLSRSVIAYDRHGFGKSDKREHLPDINFIEQELNEGLLQVVHQLNINDFIIIGHSVGGGMAIHIGAKHPQCVGVITLAAQAFIEEQTIDGIKSAKKFFAQPKQLKRLENWHGNKATWVLSAWIDTWLSESFSDWSLAPYIKQVTCPVLAIHGEQDEYGSTAFPYFIAKHVFGYSKAVILPNCGHSPHKEKPDEVIKHIKNFIHAYIK